MKLRFQLFLNKILSIEYFISFILLIAVIGLIFPYKIPLFTIFVLFYFFAFFITNRLNIRINIGNIIIFVNIYFYFLGLLWTSGFIYNQNASDIVNIFLLVLTLFCIGKIKLSNYRVIMNLFIKLVSFTIPLFSIVSLYKYLLLLNGIQLQMFVVSGRPYPWGTSLVLDYNMFALGMLIGLICLIYYFYNSRSLFCQIYLLMSIFVVIASILFAGSRRGWVFLTIFILYFLFNLTKSIYRTIQKKSGKKIYVAIGLCLLLLFIFVPKISIDITNFYELEKLEYRFSTLNNVEDSFSERTARWDYAVWIMQNSNLFQWILGQGFEYLSLFGDKFGSADGEDYPHNFLVSSLLYSGVVGFIANLIMTFLPLFIMLKNIKRIGYEMSIIYFTVLVFFMMSGNSIFSSKLLLFLILLIFNIDFQPIQFHTNRKLNISNRGLYIYQR